MATAFAQFSLETAGDGGPVSFTFGAAGDIAETDASDATLTRFASSGSAFFIAVGDLSYAGSIGTEQVWCDFVKTRLNTIPVQLLSGNHEDDGPNGLIDNYVAADCLPDRMNSVYNPGEFGKQYYFDYPSTAPLARFIMIGAGLTFTNGGAYGYTVGGARYAWLANAIDGARTAGIPWVIVGVHIPCISTGGGSCMTVAGQDLIDLLTSKRVDLVLSGHMHNYQRTKQLRCAIRTFFVPECVTPGGLNGPYEKGKGTIFVINGNAGSPPQTVDSKDSENPYFGSYMGTNTPGFGYGYVRYTVRPDRIDAVTDFSGSFQDTFSIVAPGPDLPLGVNVTVVPRDPVAGEAVTFTATPTGGAAPYMYTWDFGDGVTAAGPVASHAYASAVTYMVTLDATDGAGHVASATTALVVGSGPAPRRSFSFASTGDVGQQPTTGPVLDRLGASGTDFFLHTGDLSENTLGEVQWCTFVKDHVGPSYAYEIVSGDEEDNGPNGLIDNFVAAGCLPDRLGDKGIVISGTYAKEYYFDYPAGSPLARFILISPALTFTNGGKYSYSLGNTRYRWVASTIDGAKAAGIPWVVVGMHKGCLSAGKYGCDIGQDLLDLLLAKKVDLLLSGHEETYQRSKQIACGIRSTFVAECVQPSRFSNLYTKGQGTILVITGVGGDDIDPIKPLDTEYSYFAATMGDGTPGAANGYVQYAVYPDRIQAATDFGPGAYSDTFAILSSAPSVDFTISPTDPVVGQPVAFSATVAGSVPPYSFHWDFGDASSASGADVFHTYAAAGTYTVTLTASDSLGQISVTSHTVSVGPAPSEPLTASFTFSPASPFVDEAVTFTGAASGGTPPYTFNWAFGDGFIGSGSHVDHAYGLGGTFTVLLTVQDAGSTTATAADSITVRTRLSVDFAFAPTDPSVDEPVTFTSTAFGGIGPYMYAWAFGDGGTALTPDATHAYAAVGAFDVVLTVGASDGQTASVTKTVLVSATLSASLAWSPASPAVGDAVTFEASATGGSPPYTFEWSFGDGSVGFGSPVDHVYVSEGAFFVTLTAPDASGRSASSTKEVVVAAGLTASFTYTPLDPIVGHTVSFSGVASGGTLPYAFAWDFGDRVTNTGGDAKGESS